jgi:hypothetical protein
MINCYSNKTILSVSTFASERRNYTEDRLVYMRVFLQRTTRASYLILHPHSQNL